MLFYIFRCDFQEVYNTFRYDFLFVEYTFRYDFFEMQRYTLFFIHQKKVSRQSKQACSALGF